MSPQIFVNIYNPISLRFVAGSIEWTGSAVLCLVPFAGLLKPGTCFSFAIADIIHLLAHWAYIAVLLLIVEQSLLGKSSDS